MNWARDKSLLKKNKGNIMFLGHLNKSGRIKVFIVYDKKPCCLIYHVLIYPPYFKFSEVWKKSYFNLSQYLPDTQVKYRYKYTFFTRYFYDFFGVFFFLRSYVDFDGEQNAFSNVFQKFQDEKLRII